MPRMQRDGMPPDMAVRLRCLLGCGFIGGCPRNTAHDEAARHFAIFHHSSGGVQFGQHYDYFEAPHVCDTCSENIEPPYWLHISDPPTSVGTSIDGDGLWLVCDGCHEMWSQRNLIAWVRRTWDITVAMSPFIHDGEAATIVRADMAARYRLLMQNWDEGKRVMHAPPSTDEIFKNPHD